MFNLNKSKHILLLLGLILFLASLPLMFWFLPERLIIGIDLTFPIRPAHYWPKLLFAWLPELNGGVSHFQAMSVFIYHSVTAFFASFNIPIQAVQKLTFLFWLVLPTFSIWFLGSYLTSKNRWPLPTTFFIAFFYSFNLYRAIMFGDAAHMSIYAATPLTLLFFIKSLEENKNFLKNSIFFGLSSILASGAGANPPMYTVFLLPLIIYGLVFLIDKWLKGKFALALKSLFKTLVFSGAFLLLFNFYWILPFVSGQFQTIKVGSLTEANLVDWLGGISSKTSILNVLRMQGAWGWYSGWAGDPYVPYAHVYQQNPIFLVLSIILPLFAYSALLFKKSKYIFFFIFLTILGTLFSQGLHPPFGRVFALMVRFVPLFWIFRSPWFKFSFLVALGYSVLGGVAVGYIYNLLKKNFFPPGNGFRRLIPIGFIIFIVGTSLLYVYPFITGENFPRPGTYKVLPSLHAKLPDYVFASADWLNQKEEEFRVFHLPYMKSFIYDWGLGALTDVTFYLSDKGMLYRADQIGVAEKLEGIGAINKSVVDALYGKEQDGGERILGVLNANYILQKNDAQFDFYGEQDSPDFVKEVLSQHKNIRLEKTFGEWDLYKVDNRYFLPHFYIPERSLYVQGEEDLVGAASFGDWEARPEIYLMENIDIDTDDLEDADRIFVAGQCVRCDPSEEVEIKLPFVRFLPDSTFYSLISWKEKRGEKKIRAFNDPTRIIDLDLELANKRLVEVKELVDKGKSEDTIKKTVKRYQAKIEAISYQLGEIEKKNGDINELLLRLGDYLKRHKEVLKRLLAGRESGDEMRTLFENALWRIDGILIKIKSRQWVSEERVGKYTFDIPKETEYELFIKNEEIEDYFIQEPLSPVVFELDGKLATKPGELRSDGWVLIDKVNLERGKHKLAIILPEAKNLVEKESLFLEQEEKGKKTVSLPIINFDYTGLYKISFDYKTLRGRPAKVVLIQDTDKRDKEIERIKHKIEGDLPRDVFPQNFEIFFTPDLGAKKAELDFILEADEGGKSIFEIENIRVERVWSPKVVLRTTTEKPLPTRTIPKITFRKINPTKYKVEVEGAREPYTLIFSESFHEGWKAYVSDHQSADSLQQHEEIVASYFDGEIKEETHGDIFLDRNTFETWGKKLIAEDRHYLVNGYANSWYITPEDSGGKENYEIIIEFWPQRLFYVGIIISVLSLLGCLGYLSWSLFKGRKL